MRRVRFRSRERLARSRGTSVIDVVHVAIDALEKQEFLHGLTVGILNNGPDGLVTDVPITSAAYGLRSHIEIEPGRTGLGHVSYARCDQLRTISTARLVARRGMVGPAELSEIDRALRVVLDL